MIDRKFILPLAVVGSIAAGAVWWFAKPGGSPVEVAENSNDARIEVILPNSLSALAQDGKVLFSRNCADCHGGEAGGTSNGPPLVHKIYEPGHHGDQAFLLAARNGVRAHHWAFGDMPAQPGLRDAEIGAIVAYVRELQRANGIF